MVPAMSMGDQEPTCSSSSYLVSVTLTAADIPGLTLSEPLELFMGDANLFPKLTMGSFFIMEMSATLVTGP